MRAYSGDSVAIIGVACRFPGGVTDLESFWTLLRNGGDGISSLPEDRCSRERFFSVARRLSGHAYTNAAGIVEHIKEFDPEFFGISRKEAQNLDPQQRLCLEVAWEALEHAHILPDSLQSSRTGVFIGASNVDMALHRGDDPAAITAHATTSSALSIISNRISHFLDLRGPSLTVDTACSSSLTALHMACEDLRAGRIPLAIVGGVNILLAPFPFIGFSRARMLSPTGRCRVFDASADGYVRSEGAGAVILKPLTQAIKNGDTVLAVVEGSGVNADGRTTGISLPNGNAQAELITDIYERFGLDKNKLAYIEAHGTGTSVGDPIEATAVGEVLGKALNGIRTLWVGSVKSNIGHMEPASGMAGLIKALLVLKHKLIPPVIHYEAPNPAIDFSGLNIEVPTTLTELPNLGGDELIGINSFGFGGANAHIVLRNFTQKGTRAKAKKDALNAIKPCGPFFLTAKSRFSLAALARRYADILDGADAQSCYDTAATLARNRTQMRFRALIDAPSPADLVTGLKKLEKLGEQPQASSLITEAPQSDGSGVFVFTGNGSQWSGMGSTLLKANPSFREAVEEVDSLFAPLARWSIIDVLRDPEKHAEAFTLTEKNQPLLFALQMGLIRALAAKGLAPNAVAGHSVGEVAAAAAAGILCLADAVRVIYFRSLFQGPTRDLGGMAVTNMTEKRAVEMLAPFDGTVEIAAVNGTASLTLAGESKALRAILRQCKQERIAAKNINVPYPFHTRVMDDFRDDLLRSLQGIHPHKARIPFFSSAFAGKRKSRLDGAYWWANIRRPVHFAATIEALLSQGRRLFLEVGPAPLLCSYIRDASRRNNMRIFVGGTLSRQGNETRELDNSWKTAWKNGWSLDVAQHFPMPWRKRNLPLYPWHREFLWVPDTAECRGFLKEPRKYPLLGWQLPGGLAAFENTLTLADYPWLADHKAADAAMYPAAAFIESMLEAARDMHPQQSLELSRIFLLRPLQLAAETAVVLRTTVDPEDGGLLVETRHYLASEAFVPCAKARISSCTWSDQDQISAAQLPLSAPDSFGATVSKKALYETAAHFALHYGPAFQPVEQVWIRSSGQSPEALALLALPSSDCTEGMLIPPTLLDGAFQTLFPLLGTQSLDTDLVYLPASFERVMLHAPGIPRFAHARIDKVGLHSVAASFLLLDADGKPLMRLTGCRFRRAAWLEKKKTPPQPYRIYLEAAPHPNAEPLPPTLSAQGARQQMEKALHSESAPGSHQAAPVHPHLLLQFATLAAIHESALSFCGSTSTACDFSIDDAIASGKLTSSQEPWLIHMLEKLEQAKLAARVNGLWNIQPIGQRPAAATLWRTLVSSAPCFLQEATLLSHTAALCPAILRGEYDTRPESVLPPALVAAYYNQAASLPPFADALEQGLADLLREYKKNTGQVLQLAKNGQSLLSRMLPLLHQTGCHYTVGEKDVAAAENMSLLFSQEPGISFDALNLEDLPAPSGKYQCIFASFNLHEYDNTALALESCHAMLAPGGFLFLMEHAPSLFMDFVFGSQPSWWSVSTDRALPVSRLQTRSAWEGHLRNAGFAEICALGEESDTPSSAFILLGKKAVQASPTALPFAKEKEKEKEPRSFWLLISGEEGTPGAQQAAALADALRRSGFEAIHIRQDDAFGKARFDGQKSEDWASLLALHDKKGPLNLLYLTGYDNRPESGFTKFGALQINATSALAALAVAWDAARTENMHLWVFTGGALSDEEQERTPTLPFLPAPSQGTLVGFTRVLSNELRGPSVRLLDMHGKEPDLDSVLQELLLPTEEPEVVLAGGKRFVPRLNRLLPLPSPNPVEKQDEGCSLAFDTPGRLQNLYWKKTSPPLPGPGMVRVAARYAGLNFRDVMWSMGLLPDEALEDGFSGPTLGIECSGVVDALGEGVQELCLGDEVFGFAPACFSSHVITPAGTMILKPAGMSFAEAATLPVAFITAWYAIKHLAAMQPGERLLIHGAAGGVGLAALQIAAHLGLEVYATAGAPEKHAFLRRLGVRHIFSSRSLSFASQVMAVTQGKGVDAVLNSLAGEAIGAGLSVLRPFGRFLELGKRDFYANSPMRLAPFSNNLSYFGIDVDQLFVHQPALARSLLQELSELFAARKLVPLPYTVFPAGRAPAAFQTMQQSSHIGKIIVSLDRTRDVVRPEAPPLKRIQLSSDAAYCITGGCGGFGLATAERLVERGARHLLLLSRSGPKDEESGEKIAKLRANGIEVRIASADVADKAKLSVCLKNELATMPPLRGIIHAAAILDDGLITSLTAKRIQGSLAAKSLGAWNLHEETRTLPLDFFVLYSSATTAFGNPGQAGYVAANSMLESLASWRRQNKLPAVVIGWGPIGDTGMLARNEKAQKVLHAVLGVGALSSSEALDWLEHCLADDIAASHYFGLDWQGKVGKGDRPALASPRFARLRPCREGNSTVQEAPLEHLRSCSPEEGVALVTSLLIDEIATVLRLPKDKLTADVPLVSLGMDSLMGMELSMAIEQKFSLAAYALPLSQETTAALLAHALYERLSGDENTDGNNGESVADDDMQTVLSLERKHKANLTNTERDALLQTLRQGVHGK